MPVNDSEADSREFRATLARRRVYCRARCLGGYCTWCGESVLPSGLVFLQGLQHDVHGESKQASQEYVED